MPTVHFITFAGQRYTVDVPESEVLMQAAVSHGVPGIDGDCGGHCACGTCHVYIEAPWTSGLPRMQAYEDEMLGFANERRASSRLACQVKVTAELDGIEVHLPEGQH